MDDQYNALLKQVVDLQYKIHDATDRPDQPLAQTLRKDLQDLVADAKTKRNPRDIESRLQTIEHHIQDTHNQAEPFISMQDANHFTRVLEEIRMHVRQFENY